MQSGNQPIQYGGNGEVERRDKAEEQPGSDDKKLV